jgi:hypothetical protein
VSNRCEPETAKPQLVLLTQLNCVVNAIAFAILVFLTSTGILLHVALPHGRGGVTLLGMTRHEWGELHLVLALAFAGIVMLHLALHWRWIVCMIRGKNAKRGKLGLRGLMVFLSLILLLAIAIAPFFASTESSVSGQGNGQGWYGGR